jgi:hypothetical protein
LSSKKADSRGPERREMGCGGGEMGSATAASMELGSEKEVALAEGQGTSELAELAVPIAT